VSRALSANASSPATTPATARGQTVGKRRLTALVACGDAPEMTPIAMEASMDGDART
jgi:hypothetical protein